MSAWLCSENHINYIVNAGGGDAATFKLLVDENIRSLTARYPGRDFLQEWIDEAATYQFKPKSEPTKSSKESATLVIKSCECFDYQACETDDWRSTEACAFVEKVRQEHLPYGFSKGGLYDSLPWGID